MTVVTSLTATLGVFFSEPSAVLFIMNAAFAIAVLALPGLVRRWNLWALMATIWLGFGVLDQAAFDDHVYLFIAWLVAVAVVDHRQSGLEELQRHSRLLLGVVFMVAAGWKLAFGEFFDGSMLGLVMALDSRVEPFGVLVGMSESDMLAANEGIRSVIEGSSPRFRLPIPESSAVTLAAASIAIWALEVAVGLTHLVDSRLVIRLRPWTLVIFGVLTYGLVPVVGFAALLALLGAVAIGLQRKWVVAFAVMAVLPAGRVLLWMAN